MYIEIFLLLLKKSHILLSGSVWFFSVCYFAKVSKVGVEREINNAKLFGSFEDLG